MSYYSSLFFCFHFVATRWFSGSLSKIRLSSNCEITNLYVKIWSSKMRQRTSKNVYNLFWPLFASQLFLSFWFQMVVFPFGFHPRKWNSIHHLWFYTSPRDSFWLLLTVVTSSLCSLAQTDILHCRHYSPPSSLGAIALPFNPHLIRKGPFKSSVLIDGCRLSSRGSKETSCMQTAQNVSKPGGQSETDREGGNDQYQHDLWWLCIWVQSHRYWYKRSFFNWKCSNTQLVDKSVAEITQISVPPANGLN